MTASNNSTNNHTSNPDPITSYATDAPNLNSVLRQHAEQTYAEELDELKKEDTRQRPPNWSLSPWAVRTYLMGGTLSNGFTVIPK